MTAPDSRLLTRLTHGELKAAMLARLSAARAHALNGLTTRSDDDFTIALIDATAAVGDVVSFYNARIADEAYLSSATERLSVLELGRLIGYELGRGVAASTYLSFSLETAANTPTVTVIARGARAQSQPGPGELPQTFETVEDIEVRPAWNALPPRERVQQLLIADAGSYTIATGPLVQTGDTVLVRVGATAPRTRTVRRVETSIDGRTTRLDVGAAPTGTATFTELSTAVVAVPFSDTAPLDAGTVANRILGRVWRQSDLAALAAAQQWPLGRLEEAIRGALAMRPMASPGQLHVLRQRAALFGHNAPRHDALPVALRFPSFREKTKTTNGVTTFVGVTAAYGGSWENTTVADEAAGTSMIYLDASYPSLAPGGWVVLRDGDTAQVYRIDKVDTVARSGFTLSAKVTRLTLDSSASFEQFRLRTTTVLAGSEPLTLADVPVLSPVGGSTIQLDGPYVELTAGTRLAVTGPRSDLTGTSGGEVRTIIDTRLDDGRTVLLLDRALEHAYVRFDVDVRKRVRLSANVARATHGETTSEILGGGRAAQPFQSMSLRQRPLTYISAAGANGSQSTLEVRVNDILWTEVPTLVDQAADARVYVTRVDDDGVVSVVFGDGNTGSRLPTGADNVRATYRKGTGAAGVLGPDRLTLLMTRPLGVKDVTNPVAATGAAEPEARDDARRNAPVGVMTLGRIVSLHDYADYARAFAGIAKAHATPIVSGNERGVLLTVSGPLGGDVLPGSDLEANLVGGLRAAGDPTVVVRLASRRRIAFRLEARVLTDPATLRPGVLRAVESRLRLRFGFDARDFGQPVTIAEVVAAIHEVPGVVAVDIDALYRPDEQAAIPNAIVPAHLPAPGSAGSGAAELLLLDERPLNLGAFA